MAGDKTNYAENLVLNFLFTTGAVTRPTSWTVALYTTMPDKETGTGGVKVSGGSYTDMTVTFSASTTGILGSASTVTFPTPTAAWGSVAGYGAFDHLGNLLETYTLPGPIAVGIGSVVSIGVNGMTFSED